MNQKPPSSDPSDQAVRIPPVESARHDEALLDQAVAETFPASDPISPAMPKRPEPGDVRRDQAAARRAQAGSVAWLAFGAAVIALLAMRALRSSSDD